MLFLYEEYSYITNILYMLLDLVPPALRRLIFKIILGEYNWGFIDRKIYFRYPSKIYIGKRCSINRGCEFFGSSDKHVKKSIVIGNRVTFGPNVTIFSAGHNPRTIDLKRTNDVVIIEDNVWVGGNTTILQGVTIHEGAIVGAGSVVVNDIPPYTICAGVPARVVKDRILITN